VQIRIKRCDACRSIISGRIRRSTAAALEDVRVPGAVVSAGYDDLAAR
jgi:hypothetical protein